jgi:type I restriction-modification system DNA methylase subunit
MLEIRFLSFPRAGVGMPSRRASVACFRETGRWRVPNGFPRRHVGTRKKSDFIQRDFQMTENIKELVERFQNRINDFCSSQYSEEGIRQLFINPFFQLLGWDIDEKRTTSLLNREVVHEDRVKIEGKSKAPDYGFYINAKRQFFLEAKRASLDIFSDKESAFQLRRYGWSASLPISILTNFRQLAIYDCRIKPERDDFASKARIAKFGFEEYVERWDEIYLMLSRDAVQNGSLTTLLEAEKQDKSESIPVDDAFLAEIEDWRMELAPNIFERNDLDIRDLNFAVQAIINRLIFLRLCEDKGIEPYGRLLEIAKSKQIYQKLSQFFKQADKRYNAGLFHFYKERGRTTAPDKWTLSLQIDDKNLRRIIQSIYPPNTPYEFSVIPIEILGHVYEQFLGKIIVLDKKQQAKVENKPEVKKAGGVYYTPEYIVNYIVENTVGKLLENKTPDDVSKLSILDPACGSGSFLIGAYTYLLDWHLNYYLKHLEAYQDVMVQVAEKTWQLTSKEKKRILLNNIYGVDIDQQAVEISKLSLLLKVLEGETQKSIDYQLELYKERALPDLDNNIKCGNSLISNDFYDKKPNDPESEELRYRVNAFDWEEEFAEIMGDGGFGAVIGNPPYGNIIDESRKSYFENEFEVTEGRFDAYELFIEKGMALSSKLLGFIVPSPLLSNLYAQKLRKYILDNCRVQEISNFSMAVFSEPTVHTCIIILSPRKQVNHLVQIRKQVGSIGDLENDYDYKLPQSKLGRNQNTTFDIFFAPSIQELFSKIGNQADLLGDICFIRQCIKTGDDKKYVKSMNTQTQPWKPSLRGASIGRYAIFDNSLYVKYGAWLARNWKNKSFYETPKIVIRETGKRMIATLDLENRYILSSLYAIYPKSINEKLSLQYLLGILNSSIATYVMKVIALELTKGAFTKIRTNQLARLPIRTIDFDNPTEKSKHDKMVKLVEQMLILHQQLNALSFRKKETIQRQINRADKIIDQLVYKLYDLTPDEIAIVEEAIQK